MNQGEILIFSFNEWRAYGIRSQCRNKGQIRKQTLCCPVVQRPPWPSLKQKSNSPLSWPRLFASGHPASIMLFPGGAPGHLWAVQDRGDKGRGEMTPPRPCPLWERWMPHCVLVKAISSMQCKRADRLTAKLLSQCWRARGLHLISLFASVML